MEGRELQHIFHEHPLLLHAKQPKTNGGNDHQEVGISCHGCSIPISGPFYCCRECSYFLHKACAELPGSLDHPMHPQHPLALLEHPPYAGGYNCDLCRESGSKFVYHCSICSFDVDMKCASATHSIQDNCHPHPLTSSQDPISFPCHICLVEEKGPSYRCNICPFRVHQNCSTLLPNTAKHSYHDHLLNFFTSIPFEYRKVSVYCDICHIKLFMFQCIYGCDRCLFFAHASCARSETIQLPSTSREKNTAGQSLIILPMKQDSTNQISQFVRNFIDEDVNIDDQINHFDHKHPLILIDEEKNDKTCEACAIPISAPFYVCVDCDYFLHKCCTELPKQIRNPLHPEHQLAIRSTSGLIQCNCCRQLCDSFYYTCSECEDFEMDIKCASLQGCVYYEAHKHPLIPRFKSSSTCTACGIKPYYEYILQCNTCSFELCLMCAMAPHVVKHRYGKSEPFKLTYSAPENHYEEYICELCLKELNPKQWFYHCVFADQFTHIRCMRKSGADSNLQYGKSYMFKEVHEHKLTIISCSYDCTRCSYCREPLRTGFSVGFECTPCKFRIHLLCTRDWILREKLEGF